jgi:hypothetical protein
MASAIISSVVTAGANNHTTVSEEANAVATDFVNAGIVGAVTNTSGVAPATGSFAVNQDASPAMTVTVSAGQAYVTGTPTGQGSQKLRARMTADYTSYTINANVSGVTKFDWIYLKLDPTNAATPSATADNVITLYTSRSSNTSTDDGAPPTYGLLLAVVTVANGASSITNALISDRRVQATVAASATTDWRAQSQQVTAVTYNGNRSYSLTYGASVASFTSKGTRKRFTRTVATATQATNLNGTTQYWSKATPTGITFVGDHSYHVKGKLSAYPGASGGFFFQRQSGGGSVNGFALLVTSSGSLQVQYGNGASTTQIGTYQSLPLNKEFSLNVAVSVAAKTAVFILDGAVIPSSLLAGTATTVVQPAAAVPMCIGVDGTLAAGFYPGFIGQAGLFSSAVATATLRSYDTYQLTGSESTCIGFWSFNGVSTDASSNANTLVASGSATATAVSPFFGVQADGTTTGSLEYGIVTNLSSDGLTETVQVPEGCALPTTGGISAVAYSGVKAPFGMPISRIKWQIVTLYASTNVQAAATTATIYNPAGVAITPPIGDFIAGFDVAGSGTGSTTADKALDVGLSTSPSTFSDSSLVANFFWQTTIASGSLFNRNNIPVSLSASTPYYLVFRLTGGGVLTNVGITSAAFSRIIFELAWA